MIHLYGHISHERVFAFKSGQKTLFKEQTAGNVRVCSDIKSSCRLPQCGTCNLENRRDVIVIMLINFVPKRVVYKFCQ